nr:hypothetical protein [uncultured Agathobaculum sp.]
MSDIWFGIVWIGGYIQWIWPFVLVFAMLKAQLALRADRLRAMWLWGLLAACALLFLCVSVIRGGAPLSYYFTMPA